MGGARNWSWGGAQGDPKPHRSWGGGDVCVPPPPQEMAAAAVAPPAPPSALWEERRLLRRLQGALEGERRAFNEAAERLAMEVGGWDPQVWGREP